MAEQKNDSSRIEESGPDDLKSPDRRRFLVQTLKFGPVVSATKLGFFTGCIFRSQQALAQYIPFAFWKRGGSGKLYGMGVNTYGQLGDGTTGSKSAPVGVVGAGTATNWLSLSAAVDNSAAVKSDGTLWVWGRNDYGQIGNSLSGGSSYSSPMQVGGSWSAVSIRNKHALAIRDDKTVYAWGFNSYGQIGYWNVTNYSSPIQVFASSTVQIATGNNHSAALDSLGNLWTWGGALSGQTGQGVLDAAPNRVPGSWGTVAAGSAFMVAQAINGSANNTFAWGDNWFSQLATGDTQLRNSPSLIGGKSITAVAAGAYHALALTGDGKLWGWGDNFSFELGLGAGDTTNRNSPVQLMTGSSFTAIAAGQYNSYAIRTDGSLWSAGTSSFAGWTEPTTPIAVDGSWLQMGVGGDGTNGFVIAIRSGDKSLWGWGYNSYGQLGVGDVLERSSPTQISALSWNQVLVSERTVVAQRGDDTWWAWGANGQSLAGVPADWNFLGNGDGANRSAPLQLAVSYVQVAQSLWHGAGITSDRRLFLWGNSEFGQTTRGSWHSPNVLSAGAGLSWNLIWNTNGDSFAARKSDGSVWVLGQNAGFGKLGLGDKLDRNSPVQLAGSWVSIAYGTNHAIAIQGAGTSGTLWAVGEAFGGATGIGANVSVVTQVGAVNNWVKVAATGRGTALLDAAGAMYVMGTLGTGLGLGDVLARGSPVLLPSGASTWSDVVIGGDTFLAVKANGTLWGWGSNSNGQIGVGDLLPRSSPVQIGTQNYWTKVVAGRMYSAAFTNDSRVFVWGYNPTGTLGLGDSTSRSSPTQLPGSWIAICLNKNNQSGNPPTGNGGGIKSDGSLWVWGQPRSASSWAFGMGTTAPWSGLSMVQVGIGISFTQLVMGWDNYYALDTVGNLYTWGANRAGSLGINYNEYSPVQIDGSWLAVAPGDFVVGIKMDHTVWTWGANSYGQLGVGDTLTRFSPVQITGVSLPVGSWVQVATYGKNFDANRGVGTVIIRRSDNVLYGWGANSYGQLGVGDTLGRSTPVLLPYTMASLSVGFGHAGGIKSDGTLWLAGDNSFGTLGQNDFVMRSSPTQVSGSWAQLSVMRNNSGALDSAGRMYLWGYLANSGFFGQNIVVGSWNKVASTRSWSAVAAGWQHAIAMDSTGQVYTWGANGSGQLGTRDTTYRPGPTFLVSGADRIGANLLSSYYRISLSAGIWAFGSNSFGQLGTGNTTHTSSPVQVSGTWATVATGPAATHILATKSDNSLWAWGQNNLGQLGDGTYTNRSSPVAVSGLTGSSFSVLAVGQGISAAVRSTDNALFTWGLNNGGQLGLSTTAWQPWPLAGSWSFLASGHDHMAAIKSDGTLWLWGLNTSGQLGLGDVLLRSSPVQVNGGGSWNFVTCGNAHTLARKTDGTWWSWGSNANGQLGLNVATAAFSAPQALAASFTFAAAGTSHTIARNASGNGFAFGLNTSGQLGLGDTTARSSPVALSGNWSLMSAGTNHSIGAKS